MIAWQWINLPDQPRLGHLIGPGGSYASLPSGAQWLLSLSMLLGRLEVLTVLEREGRVVRIAAVMLPFVFAGVIHVRSQRASARR